MLQVAVAIRFSTPLSPRVRDDGAVTNSDPSEGEADREWWRSAVIYQIYPRSFAVGVGARPGVDLVDDSGPPPFAVGFAFAGVGVRHGSIVSHPGTSPGRLPPGSIEVTQ